MYFWKFNSSNNGKNVVFFLIIFIYDIIQIILLLIYSFNKQIIIYIF